MLPHAEQSPSAPLAASPAAPGAAGRGLRLLVSLPALNEERTIADVIGRIPRQVPGVQTVEVLVVNDGSTDATAARAAQAGATVIDHPSRRGCGAAFHTTLAYLKDHPADLLVTIDADGQFDPADIPTLVEPLVRGQADFVTASRFVDPALTPAMPGIKKWGNRVMSRLVSRLARQKFYDVSCGMRGYSLDATLHLNLMGAFTYTQEVFLNLAFKHLRIREIPIRVKPQREHGKSRVASNLWRYGANTLRIILRCYRDYQPMRFFSVLAAMQCVVGLGLEGFLLVHFVRTHSFSPHLWAGFLGGAILFMGALTFVIGMVADMFNRHRVYLEELLYESRKRNGGRRSFRLEAAPGDPPGQR